MNLRDISKFKRNEKLSKEEIKKQLKEVENSLISETTISHCPKITCYFCVFKDTSKTGFCLPDYFSDEDNNYPYSYMYGYMYGRFLKSLSYYREKFIQKNSYIQEEMEI